MLKTTPSLVLLSTLVFPLAAQAAPKTMWRLEQVDPVRGKTVVYFTNDEVKIVTSSSRLLVSKAPDWNVHTFRPDDKVISHQTQAEFFKNRLAHEKKRWKREMRPAGTEQIFSITADLYRRYDETLAVGRFPGVAPEVCDVITKYYKEPRVDGVFLRSVVPRKDTSAPIKVLGSFADTRGYGVSLVSIKKLPYKASDFSIPTGYKVVKNDLGISFSSDKKREAEVLLEDIGIGIELGKSPSKPNRAHK